VRSKPVRFHFNHLAPFRLEEVLHQDSRLYLVFEYMQMDLKKYMDSVEGKLNPMLVKVCSCISD
jgi:hypothetical protein